MSSQTSSSGKTSISIMLMFGLIFWGLYFVGMTLIGMSLEEQTPALLRFMELFMYSLIAISVFSLAYLLVIGKQRRYARLSLRPWKWYIFANFLMYFGGFFVASALPVFFGGRMNRFLGDSVYPMAVMTGWLFIYAVPLLIGFVIYAMLSRAITVEVHRAFFTQSERTDEFRFRSLQTQSDEYRLGLDDLLAELAIRSSKNRLYFITQFWTEDVPKDGSFDDALVEYYAEPLLLCKMSKQLYGNSPYDCRRSDAMVESQSSGSEGPLQVPAKFDLVRIEQDLLRYRMDKGVIAAYVQGILIRFKSAQQRKAIEELFRHLDLVVTFNDKVYAARASKGKLSLQNLEEAVRERELELKLAQLDTQLDQERDKRNVPPATSTPELSSDEKYAIRKEAVRREVTEQEEIKEIVSRIKRTSKQNEMMRNVDALQQLIERHTDELVRIDGNSTLGPTARREARRKAEELFMKQLESFERGL
jgi:hypothetical protein